MRIKIAGIVIALTAGRSAESLWLEQAYHAFLSDAKPDVTVQAHFGALPDIRLRDQDRLFDSQMVWSLYRVAGKYVFALRSPVHGRQPYFLAVFDDEFRHGETYNRLAPGPDGPFLNPLEYPISELLIVCLLARGRGLLVHACGLDVDGAGYLFAGNSTHGKTTTARLWQDRAAILNDDRIVLRQQAGETWMYGTPWHGELSNISPHGVPLSKIFFLRHAEENDLCRLEGLPAASGLFTRCFPPLWDAEGTRFSLDFCAQVTAEVPCYDLGFLPDESVVDFVLSKT